MLVPCMNGSLRYKFLPHPTQPTLTRRFRRSYIKDFNDSYVPEETYVVNLGLPKTGTTSLKDSIVRFIPRLGNVTSHFQCHIDDNSTYWKHLKESKLRKAFQMLRNQRVMCGMRSCGVLISSLISDSHLRLDQMTSRIFTQMDCVDPFGFFYAPQITALQNLVQYSPSKVAPFQKSNAFVDPFFLFEKKNFC